ncbi:hypothetical protein ACFZCU_27745 [Streptomyces canus]|uniref:hypothetical protein n=1 Tax=Streptomyces canus TaxID=58343 RepID=UPI0036E7AE9B
MVITRRFPIGGPKRVEALHLARNVNDMFLAKQEQQRQETFIQPGLLAAPRGRWERRSASIPRSQAAQEVSSGEWIPLSREYAPTPIASALPPPVGNSSSGSWNLVYLTGASAEAPLTLQSVTDDGSQDWKLVR